MNPLFKRCLFPFLLVFGWTDCSPAAVFTVERGISLDIWETWPDESRWSEPYVLLPYPEWQKRIGTTELEALRMAGFDFVRIPVDPAPLLSERAANLRDALLQSILDGVRLVNQAGLKAIVDMHLIPSGGNAGTGSFETAGDPVLFDRYVSVVRRMAETLSGEDPAMTALELMNEPVAGCDGGEVRWDAMQKRLHATARAAAPHLTLVLTGGCWSDAESLAAIDPNAYADGNILWTFHSYRPFLLTHQGAEWAGDFIRHVTGIPYPPFGENAPARDAALARAVERIRNDAPLFRRAGMIAYLHEQAAEIDTESELQAEMASPFETVSRWAARHGVAQGDILLGEFGMIRQEYGSPDIMQPRWRASYIADMVALAEGYGFSWAIWGYGGAFGVVDAFDGESAEPDVLDFVRKLP